MRFLSRTALKWASLPIGLMASAGLVWQGSHAAFSSTTAPPASNWATGTVALSNDTSNTALFTAAGLKPGSTATKCIAVTSTGTLPAAVKLYATGETSTNALDANINLTVKEGSGTSGGTCVGFVPAGASFNGTLASFASTYTNYASGFGTFAPTGAGSQAESYQL
ncbi:MAG: hypothetical protein ACRDZY_20930, partial [Acidimicrobiales bacterium]